ncbi:MAG: PhzF family phenazine biosynthesis protein [Gemmataceae bacterium]
MPPNTSARTDSTTWSNRSRKPYYAPWRRTSKLAATPARGIIVTSRSADALRLRFRFAAPASGIDEDPVTGSAHCCLAAFWRKRLGKSEFVAFQASARGGVVKVRIVTDRAFLGGKATTVARGELTVEDVT